jgi:hypothetical protein
MTGRHLEGVGQGIPIVVRSPDAKLRPIILTNLKIEAGVRKVWWSVLSEGRSSQKQHPYQSTYGQLSSIHQFDSPSGSKSLS